MTISKMYTWQKSLIVLAVIALGTIVTGNPVLSADKKLNILTWCDHTDPNLLRPFEQKHNVRINMKEYDGTGVALALLEQSQPGDWDDFVVDSIDVKRVVKLGLLEPSKFLANSFFYLQPDEAFDKAMLDVWTEFLQH